MRDVVGAAVAAALESPLTVINSVVRSFAAPTIRQRDVLPGSRIATGKSAREMRAPCSGLGLMSNAHVHDAIHLELVPARRDIELRGRAVDVHRNVDRCFGTAPGRRDVKA